MEAITLFKESLEWLKNNYDKYQFFTERDIVWTIQKYLRNTVKHLKSYRIVNDWPMIKGKKRSLCADLVILENDQPMVAVEFKYEPDLKNRERDFSENKRKQSVVFWSGEHSVEADIKRIRRFAAYKKFSNKLIGISIFIDEGRKYCNRKKFPGNKCKWMKCGKKNAMALISWSNDDY